jgi:uncharacterized protein YndB with AHSA1/START domain
VTIHAPVQAVFEYVSDLTRHPEWSSGQLRIKAITTGAVQVGKEYTSYGEVAWQKRRRNTVRVTEYEAPHRFGFVAQDPRVGNVSHVFTFTEKQGGVLVERTMTLALHPIVAFVFRYFIYPGIGAPSMDKSLELLKARLEKN